MSEEYRPYEEWWQEKVSLAHFLFDVIRHISLFKQNMLFDTRKNTRKEWMEIFILWMEYKADE